MHRQLSPILAFGIATLGIALFSTMDALMKGLVLSMGVYNALTWRLMAGVAMLSIPYAASRPKRPALPVLRIHLTRGIVSTFVAFMFFYGLSRIPMAQAIALSFIAPIIALFLAALILKERITRTTLFATMLAFAGVLTILWGQSRAEMGAEAFWGALAILASAVGYAWNLILMRQQSLVATPMEASFYQSSIMMIAFLLAAPWFISVPSSEHLPALLGAAALATASMLLLSWAYRHAAASYLAPTEYTGFLWATIWGWIVFNETLSFFTLVGASLIVAGCLLAVRRKPSPSRPESIPS